MCILTNSKLNGKDLYRLLLGGYNNLKANRKYIDSLNVFPVPDGDTGENMLATLEGGINNAKNIESVGEMMSAFSKGCLFTARGNSGVILSQYINGIAKCLKDAEIITTEQFSFALKEGANCAYSSVMRPVEGTVLTVMRESADFLLNNLSNLATFVTLFNLLNGALKTAVDNTINQLQVLKDAGVVDSGAAGLLCIFEGMWAVMEDREINYTLEEETTLQITSCGMEKNAKLKYGYCTEFILQLMDYKKPFNLKECIAFLQSIGDSVVCVNDGDIVKAHVHTFFPEKVISYAHDFGELITTKIENMDVQNSSKGETEVVKKPTMHKKFAVVCVANGDGIKDYFLSVGADVVVNGGQTQNTSANEFILAFNELDAENIIVLPNNKNIILAARQACELYKNANCVVLETKSIAEGYSALSMMDTGAETLEEFVSSMSGFGSVTTGCVTNATRDAKISGIDIKEKDYLAIINGSIMGAYQDKNQAVLTLLEKIPDIDDKQMIIVFYGDEVSEEEKDSLEEILLEKYPLFDIGFICGKQKIYHYILSVE